jgi:hypothetical protein
MNLSDILNNQSYQIENINITSDMTLSCSSNKLYLLQPSTSNLTLTINSTKNDYKTVLINEEYVNLYVTIESNGKEYYLKPFESLIVYWSGNEIVSTKSSILPGTYNWGNAQESKLMASDGAANDYLGVSSSISSDGNTCVLGTYTSTGVYIFTRSGTTWSQQAKLIGSDTQSNDYFGQSCSISSDGNTCAVGAKNAGAVYIFTRSGTTWSQQAKLIGSDTEAGDSFGWYCAISDDGNTCAVGALYDDEKDSDAGAAYIFTRSGSTWTQQAKLMASDGAEDDNFGNSVNISGDGDTCVVGAYKEDTNGERSGAAYIFTRSGSTWKEQQKLLPFDGDVWDNFAWGTAISSDGNTCVIGAQGEDTKGSNAGAAYIFTRSGNTWSHQAKLMTSDAQHSDDLGFSCSISSDGNTCVVAASSESEKGQQAGAAYIFTRSGNTWSEQTKLMASDGQSSDHFGQSCDISGNGGICVIGAYGEDTKASDAGAAYIFNAEG